MHLARLSIDGVVEMVTERDLVLDVNEARVFAEEVGVVATDEQICRSDRTHRGVADRGAAGVDHVRP